MIEQADALRDPKSSSKTLLDGLGELLREQEWGDLVGVVVEAQARGPEAGDRVAAWRRVYVEGCPMDNIHRVLWHSFQDPKADPQDLAWLPLERAMANVERYIRLEFPRTGAMTYGPGLGCEQLWTNTRDGVRELRRLGEPYIFVLQSLNLCRNVLSPALRVRIDADAGLRAIVRDGPRPRAVASLLDALQTSSEPWMGRISLEERGHRGPSLWLRSVSEIAPETSG